MIFESPDLFVVSVETKFSASHSVKLADGSKEPSHSHKWSVIAEVSSEQLNSDGMVIDFVGLKAMLDKIVADLTNSSMEKMEYFTKKHQSTETIAQYIYEKLEPQLPEDLELESIKVIEKPGFMAEFRKKTGSG